MASPLMALCTWIGTLVGYHFVKNKELTSKQLYSFIILPMIFIGVDLSIDTREYLTVQTNVTINASIETVGLIS